MRISPKARMNRLFTNGRCLDVAHRPRRLQRAGLLVGLEDMARVVDTLIAAGPDAIQMNYGQADLLQARPEKDKPALVMRIDMGNPYNAQRHRVMWSMLQNHDEPIIGALEMDAACVVVNLFMLPDEPDLFRQCVENISQRPRRLPPLRHAADDRAAGHAAQRCRGGYQVDGDAEKIVTAGAARRRDGRRHHQGRPDRPTRRISTASSRRRACRCWCAAAARRICKTVLREVGGAAGAGRAGPGLWPQHLSARQPEGAWSTR